MKSIIKIMSACVLVVAAVNCSALEQGQKVIIGIKNNLVVPGAVKQEAIFGNVYETTAGGKVLGENPQYYKIPYDQCLKREVYKPKSLTGRITKHHRVIFATTEQALKEKVMKNKNSNEVESVKIHQSTKQKNYDEMECYSIKKGAKKTIKIAPNMSCGECNGKYIENPTAMNIKDI